MTTLHHRILEHVEELPTCPEAAAESGTVTSPIRRRRARPVLFAAHPCPEANLPRPGAGD